jgi:hypothetical protein
MLLLLSALLAPEGIGIALAAIGLAGLMMFRLAAMAGGWAPRGTFSLPAQSALDDSPGHGTGTSRAAPGVTRAMLHPSLPTEEHATSPR